MKAYKFRGACPLDFIGDIIINQRLFCARHSELNDPIEGWHGLSTSFSPDETARIEAQRALIAAHQTNLRICSLSTKTETLLVWSFYASGFTGVAIEMEIPEAQRYAGPNPDDRVRVRCVEYKTSNNFGGIADSDPSGVAYEAFSRKMPEWEHESEVRIIAHESTLAEGKFYHLDEPVKRVIVGQRINLETWDYVQGLCKERQIQMAVAMYGPGYVKVLDIGYEAEFMARYSGFNKATPRSS